MAVYNQWHQAAQQHLANRQQEDSATPAVLVHQHRAALVAVQDLERQRLGQSTPDQVGEQLQSHQHQQS